jgi:hypothetical protein
MAAGNSDARAPYLLVNHAVLVDVRRQMAAFVRQAPPLTLQDCVGFTIEGVVTKLARDWLPRNVPLAKENLLRLIHQAIGVVILADIRVVRASGFLPGLWVPGGLAALEAAEAYMRWHDMHSGFVVEITNKVRRGEPVTEREQLIRQIEHSTEDLFGDVGSSLTAVADTLDEIEGKLGTGSGSPEERRQDRDARRRAAEAWLLELLQDPDPCSLFFVGRDGGIRAGESQLATRAGTRRKKRTKSLETPSEKGGTIEDDLDAREANLARVAQTLQVLRAVQEIRVAMLAREKGSRARRIVLENYEALMGELSATALADKEGLDRSSITKAQADVTDEIRRELCARGIGLPE